MFGTSQVFKPQLCTILGIVCWRVIMGIQRFGSCNTDLKVIQQVLPGTILRAHPAHDLL